MNFTIPRYAFLFLNSETYIVYVINCKWSRSVNFLLYMFCMRYKHVFFPTWCCSIEPPQDKNTKQVVRKSMTLLKLTFYFLESLSSFTISFQTFDLLNYPPNLRKLPQYSPFRPNRDYLGQKGIVTITCKTCDSWTHNTN